MGTSTTEAPAPGASAPEAAAANRLKIEAYVEAEQNTHELLMGSCALPGPIVGIVVEYLFVVLQADAPTWELAHIQYFKLFRYRCSPEQKLRQEQKK